MQATVITEPEQLSQFTMPFRSYSQRTLLRLLGRTKSQLRKMYVAYTSLSYY